VDRVLERLATQAALFSPLFRYLLALQYAHRGGAVRRTYVDADPAVAHRVVAASGPRTATGLPSIWK
jgi:hypothetical protein